MLKNLISTSQFIEPKELDAIFTHADMLASPYKKIDPYYLLRGKIVGMLFLEKSTRTQSSFEIAIKKLGGQTYNFIPENSSLNKDESLDDTIKILSQYVDMLIIRCRDHSVIERTAALGIPVINAGSDEHPVQAITDIYTLKKETGKIHGSNILLMGDLKYNRSIASLINLLKLFKHVRLHLYSPPELSLPKPLFYENIIFIEEKDIKNTLSKVDAVYVTRLQKELYPDGLYEHVKNGYSFGKNEIDLLKKDAIVMHPLPRNNELSCEIDTNPKAAYFRQAKNGLYTKMGILREVFYE